MQLIVFVDGNQQTAREQGWKLLDLYFAIGRNLATIGEEMGVRLESGSVPLSLEASVAEMFWDVCDRSFGEVIRPTGRGYMSPWLIHVWDYLTPSQIEQLTDRIVALGWRLGWATVLVAVADPLPDELDSFIEIAEDALSIWEWELEKWTDYETGKDRSSGQ